MPGPNTLAEFAAEFSAKGLDGVRAAVEDLGKSAAAAKARTAELTKAVASGEWGRQVRQAEQYRRQLQQVEAQQKRLALQARYGRAGGALAYYGDLAANSAAARGVRAGAGVAGGALAAGAATVTGMARAGFTNTVEMNRFQLELQMAARELAGAFTPALRVATKVMGDLRKWLEQLTPQEQNAMAGGTALVGGTVAASMLSRQLLGVGLGGLAAGAGRMAIGRSALGMLGPAGVAIGVGSMAPSDVKASPYAGMSDAQLQAQLAQERGSSTWAGRRFRNTFGSVGAGVFDAVNWTQKQFTGVSYQRDNVNAPVTQIEEEMARRKAAQAAAQQKPNADRRKVTLADAGFEAVGSSYERLTTALAKVDANADDRDATTQIRDIVKDMWTVLKAKVTGPELK